MELLHLCKLACARESTSGVPRGTGMGEACVRMSRSMVRNSYPIKVDSVGSGTEMELFVAEQLKPRTPDLEVDPGLKPCPSCFC